MHTDAPTQSAGPEPLLDEEREFLVKAVATTGNPNAAAALDAEAKRLLILANANLQAAEGTHGKPAQGCCDAAGPATAECVGEAEVMKVMSPASYRQRVEERVAKLRDQTSEQLDGVITNLLRMATERVGGGQDAQHFTELADIVARARQRL